MPPYPRPLPPTGAQFEITAGDVTATVTEVGAGLRAFTSAGLPYVEASPSTAGRPAAPGPSSCRGPTAPRAAG